jgi:hypothetical protein
MFVLWRRILECLRLIIDMNYNRIEIRRLAAHHAYFWPDSMYTRIPGMHSSDDTDTETTSMSSVRSSIDSDIGRRR